MTRSTNVNPTGRFTGLAQAYAKYRPGYPRPAVDYILERCQVGPGARVVDVGCGTGISTRLLSERDLRVMGIEPNAEMRAKARAEPAPPGGPAPEYRDGRAEAMGLASGSVDLIIAAQAFHWFEPASTLREFHRVLMPGGWVALLWNERDADDPFTAAYSEVIRRIPETASVEATWGRTGTALLTHPGFCRGEVRLFPNEQELTQEGLMGRAFSASYAPKEPEAARALEQALCQSFNRHQHDGVVALRYLTSVYSARHSIWRP